MWWYTEDLLLLVGQQEEIASLSGIFVRTQMLALFPSYAFEAVKRYTQMQGIVYPSVVASVFSIIAVFPLLYVFVIQLNWGVFGASLASAISTWMMLFSLLAVIFIRKLYKKTWPGLI
jgi:MATE family multidrug resistance protein